MTIARRRALIRARNHLTLRLVGVGLLAIGAIMVMLR